MRFLLPATLLLALVPATAGAVSVDEIVALSKAGVSEQVIVTLIERDQTVFALDSHQLLALKNDGVSDQVLIAMMLSGRQELPTAGPAPVGLDEAPVGQGSVGTNPQIPQSMGAAHPPSTVIILFPYPYLIVAPRAQSNPHHGALPAPGTGIFFTNSQAGRGIFFNAPQTEPRR